MKVQILLCFIIIFACSQLYGYASIYSEYLQFVSVSIKNYKIVFDSIGPIHNDMKTSTAGSIDEKKEIFYLLAEEGSTSHHTRKIIGLDMKNGSIKTDIPIRDVSPDFSVFCRPDIMVSNEPSTIFATLMNNMTHFYIVSVNVETGKTSILNSELDFYTVMNAEYNPDLNEIYIYGALNSAPNGQLTWLCLDATSGEEKYRYTYEYQQVAMSPMVYEKTNKMLWSLSSVDESCGWCITSYDPSTKVTKTYARVSQYWLSDGIRVTMDEKNRVLWFIMYDKFHGASFLCEFQIGKSQSLGCTQCDPSNGCPLGLSYFN